MPPDFEETDGDGHKATPSSKSAAALEAELQAAKQRVSKHNAERAVFFIVLLIVWDAHTFKSFDGWAPVVSLMVLELVGLFIVAYRLDMHEVVALFWAAMKAYSRKDPGDAVE